MKKDYETPKNKLYIVYELTNYVEIGKRRVDIGEYYVETLSFTSIKDLLLKTTNFSNENFIKNNVFENEIDAIKYATAETVRKISTAVNDARS